MELKKNKILIDVRPFTTQQYGVFGIPDTDENRHANFLDCHVKNSYFMADTVTLQQLSYKQSQMASMQGQQPTPAFERDMDKLRKVEQIQLDFLQAYRENYAGNLIVIIGNRFNYGDAFARFAAERGLVSKICVLKGGIDAFREDYPTMLRKARNNQ